jgi:hypothetical protein
VSCAVPMTLSSPTGVNARLSIVHPPRLFKTSRASFGPRHEGVCFYQRWPLEGPRHSASFANRSANGFGSPRFRASAAARNWSITLSWISRSRRTGASRS